MAEYWEVVLEKLEQEKREQARAEAIKLRKLKSRSSELSIALRYIQAAVDATKAPGTESWAQSWDALCNYLDFAKREGLLDD